MVKFKQDTIDGIVGKVKDNGKTVTISKAYFKNLIEQASFDSLTGLLNLKRFEDQLEHDVSVARRHIRKGGDPDNLVLMSIDVNDLKYVNDTYGHAKGDKLLKRTANALYHFLQRKSDTVAHLHGDEFAAILPQTDMKNARFTAMMLQEGAKELGVLISVGMASYQLSVKDPLNNGDYTRSLSEVIEELKEKADKSMYANKKYTKNDINTAEFYDKIYGKSGAKSKKPEPAYVA